MTDRVVLDPHNQIPAVIPAHNKPLVRKTFLYNYCVTLHLQTHFLMDSWTHCITSTLYGISEDLDQIWLDWQLLGRGYIITSWLMRDIPFDTQPPWYTLDPYLRGPMAFRRVYIHRKDVPTSPAYIVDCMRCIRLIPLSPSRRWLFWSFLRTCRVNVLLPVRGGSKWQWAHAVWQKGKAFPPALARPTARLPGYRGLLFWPTLHRRWCAAAPTFHTYSSLGLQLYRKTWGNALTNQHPTLWGPQISYGWSRGLQTAKMPHIQHLKTVISSVSDLRERDGWIGSPLLKRHGEGGLCVGE